MSKDGSYKVIALPPEKLFIGKLYDFRKYDASTEFGVIYRETVSGKYYGKRTSIGGFILDKEYMICPEKCKLELLTPRSDAVYTLLETNARGKMTEKEQNLMELPVRTPKARGVLISSKQLAKITHKRYLMPEELEVFRSNVQPAEKEEHPESDGEVAEEMTDRSAAQVPEKTAEKPVSPEKTVLAAAAEKPADLPDEAAEVPAAVPEKKMPGSGTGGDGASGGRTRTRRCTGAACPGCRGGAGPPEADAHPEREAGKTGGAEAGEIRR